MHNGLAVELIALNRKIPSSNQYRGDVMSRPLASLLFQIATVYSVDPAGVEYRDTLRNMSHTKTFLQ